MMDELVVNTLERQPVGGLRMLLSRTSPRAPIHQALQRLRRRGWAQRAGWREWRLTPLPADLLADILSLVCRSTPGVATINGWRAWDRILAEDWAVRTHLRASDNIVRVPPVPAVLAGSV